MKKKSMYLLVSLLGLQFFVSPSYAGEPLYLDPAASVDARVEDLLSRMTLREKLGQMDQYTGEAELVRTADGQWDYAYKQKNSKIARELEKLIKAGLTGSLLKVPNVENANKLQHYAEQSRLKIPLLIATDAIHGHGMYLPGATIFPTPIGLASTFDPELVKRIAEATAQEMRATGYQWTFSPNLDVARDARWGRVGETFGEDPLLVTDMGLAMIHGYQGDDLGSPNSVAANAKHFVAGSEPVNGINAAPMDVSERALQEIYFPPFKAAVRAGVATFMAAHHEINGVPCHANTALIRGTLKRNWGFNGFVVSDWLDIEALHNRHRVAETMDDAYRLSLEAGIDMHMHGPGYLESLYKQIEAGEIPVAYVDDAVRRILRVKFKLGLFENRYVDPGRAAEVVLSPAHKVLALEAARKSIVLLKNRDDILPLSKKIKSVLVTGPSADRPMQLGDWVQPQPEDQITTVLEGIRDIVSSGTQVEYYDPGEIRTITEKAIDVAKEKAKQVDAVIAVVGENAIRMPFKKRTAGENVARHDLQLPGMQTKLVKALYESGTPLIVVLINTRPLATVWMEDNVPAVVEAWEPGMSGGQAVAEVLFGDVNPGGKMSMTAPRSVGHLQEVYNHRPSYDIMDYAFDSSKPLYPFGYGLSYTTFEYSNLKLPRKIKAGENLKLSVNIKNTGDRDGEEVVMVFLNDVYSSVTTPVKELKAYRRVMLKKGRKQRIDFEIQADQMALLDIDLKQVVEPGTFEIYVGDLTGSVEVVN